MAVTNFVGGHLLAAVGDAVVERQSVTTIIVKKVTSNGTVTIGDGSNQDVFVTPSLTAGNVVVLVFNPPWDTDGVRLKAVGLGTAEITVFHPPDMHPFVATV